MTRASSGASSRAGSSPGSPPIKSSRRGRVVATVAQCTRAPARRRAREASLSVAPVVRMSSTRRTLSPRTLGSATKAPDRFLFRAAAESPFWVRGALLSRRNRRWGSPMQRAAWAARSPAGSKPRTITLRRGLGTPTTKSHSS